MYKCRSPVPRENNYIEYISDETKETDEKAQLPVHWSVRVNKRGKCLRDEGFIVIVSAIDQFNLLADVDDGGSGNFR